MLQPGATIGILGGGQLGRMMAIAAAGYGLKACVYCPDAGSPAFEVAASHIQATWDDEAALADFCARVDVITYEFENIPAATVAFLMARKPMAPGLKALETSQDRLTEKTFVASLGVGVAPFAQVDSVADLESALRRLGRPAILKTRRFGYDGKGQVRINDGDSAAAAFAAIGGAPAILEGFVPFEREISVIAARGAAGEFAAFDVCENVHRHHILDVTSVPASISGSVQEKAIAAARAIADALDYVGVLTVEMFVLADGETLLVNETAPRVHNSGHWTIEGARTSQFQQHVRAVCGWPLGDTTRLGRATMTNLIGDDIDAWRTILAEPGASLHLYGKAEARAGRKMGHVTRILPE
ncbi:N5-carboxyaminoimidazole ribonucleotide synthase [Camelimonas fluminis]|uniref:N5-carboxyaminoimidazole ribonucleotide synthase n=1 Tax=Camelimonas fluminis TaxID=1576911 RepID=A0ABV7UJY2_9HYPH|nr:5-(carboxyamino)imidazole ribonucleotide synthase [Camelimonas fluminis]GHE59763.1 N5-carboxyaminoimidazole ribonucleotide synthase [Camelimonas fluminis]